MWSIRPSQNDYLFQRSLCWRQCERCPRTTYTTLWSSMSSCSWYPSSRRVSTPGLILKVLSGIKCKQCHLNSLPSANTSVYLQLVVYIEFVFTASKSDWKFLWCKNKPPKFRPISIFGSLPLSTQRKYQFIFFSI